MEELFLLLMQAFLELLGYMVSMLPFELMSYIWECDKNNRTPVKCILMFLTGLWLGWLSLMFFPKSAITVSWVRGVVLFAAPVATGLASKGIAEYWSQKKDDVWPERHFWYSFLMCFGFGIVRYIYCVR